MATLTSEDFELIENNLHLLSAQDKEFVIKALDALNNKRQVKKCQQSLIEFALAMMPEYKVGLHHKKLAMYLEDMAYNRRSRVIINIAPRFGKSQLSSIFFPAWFIGNFPDKKIMMVSHTAELAVDFGRKVRNLLEDPKYQEIFPGVTLAKDSKSAGRWSTNYGGEYFAVGVGGALAGRGADFLCIDDPHNEQDILNGNYEVFDRAYEWYAYGARTRLSPTGRVALIMTRWADQDLSGQLVRDMVKNPGSDQWDLVEFPALFENEDAPFDAPPEERYRSLWPEQWSVAALLSTKASMPAFQWSAQYMQDPTSKESAIIKREWWQEWVEDDPPECEFTIMTLDAAAEKNNRADYTGITVWGVFYREDEETGRPTANLILLNAIKIRVDFPELKRLAAREYNFWQPDAFTVEKKSSGTPLYQEFRAIGLPVQEFTPHRGTGDKFVRLNSVSDIFASGLVWYPVNRRWAEEVVDEVCSFPAAPNDDLTDCLVGGTQILMADGTTKSIELVQIGELVATPMGPKPVTAAACTGEFKTWQMTTGGKTIEGTANHPIATTRGWKTLDAINMSDTIKVSNINIGGKLWRFRQKMRLLQSQLYLKGTNTTATQTLRKWRTAVISCVRGVESYCTGLFGSFTTGLSRQGITSTIKMETGITTTFQTLSVCPPQNTIKSTSNTVASFTRRQKSLNNSTRSAHWLQSGTAVMKEGSGTESTQKTPYQKCTKGCASFNKRSVKTQPQKTVRYVGRSLRRLALALHYAQTRARVEGIRENSELKKVYNLSVADAHCFYANGILTHNCTIMALMRFRTGGFIALPSDTWDDEEDYEPVRAAYY